MRRPLKRAFVVSVLLAMASSSAAGWSVALHLAIDDHHSEDRSHDGGVLGLEMALHGHAHTEGTPPHGHPVIASVAAPIPAKLLLLMGAMLGDAPERVATATSGRRARLQAGPTHDPPGALEAVSVLRI